MRDYIGSRIVSSRAQLADLRQQETIIREAKGPENKSKRDNAEKRAAEIREVLRTSIPPTATHKFFDATDLADAVRFRTQWQQRNLNVDCLQELDKCWQAGSAYYEQIVEAPKIDLNLLPAYSFVIRFTFTLAQPYISHDEQDFYIIDNPVRKDKIFGLPYVASTSWKGSLRSALWQLEHIAKDQTIQRVLLLRLFGNDKKEKDQEKLHAGRLYFFPTFFTRKSLEIINPQDRKLRIGSLPILFESVPQGTTGIFTLLYAPFDRIGEDIDETASQVSDELLITAKGLQAMFCVHGFGAKTHSGFGLAKDNVQEMSLELRVAGISGFTNGSLSFEQMLGSIAKVAQDLRN